MKFSITITECDVDAMQRILTAINPLPKVPAAPAVCSTVDAAQPPIATDSSPAPTAAFAPPAPNPVPVAPPVVPIAAPPAPIGTSTSSVELDSEGLPWDGRIHASTKAKVANGTWRTRRGLDNTEYARIKAELVTGMGAPKQVDLDWATPHLKPVPPAPAASEVFPPLPPILAPAPAVPQPPAASVAPTALTFAALIQKITAMSAMDSPGTQAKVLAAVQKVGLPSLPLLAARPDLLPHVAAELGIVA